MRNGENSAQRRGHSLGETGKGEAKSVVSLCVKNERMLRRVLPSLGETGLNPVREGGLMSVKFSLFRPFLTVLARINLSLPAGFRPDSPKG